MGIGHKQANDDLSPDDVRDILHYDPGTGIFTWRQTLSKRAVAGKRAGFSQKGEKNRIKIGIRGKEYMAHRLAWVYVTGEWPEHEVDHRDEDRSNNRWGNLREATPSENHRNRGKQKNNTSGYKGVTYVAHRRRYIAGVKLNGKRHNLGSFMTAEEAYAAYCEAAERLHGKDWAKF